MTGKRNVPPPPPPGHKGKYYHRKELPPSKSAEATVALKQSTCAPSVKGKQGAKPRPPPIGHKGTYYANEPRRPAADRGVASDNQTKGHPMESSKSKGSNAKNGDWETKDKGSATQTKMHGQTSQADLSKVTGGNGSAMVVQKTKASKVKNSHGAKKGNKDPIAELSAAFKALDNSLSEIVRDQYEEDNGSDISAGGSLDAATELLLDNGVEIIEIDDSDEDSISPASTYSDPGPSPESANTPKDTLVCGMPPGLPNFGNFCYMISALQAFQVCLTEVKTPARQDTLPPEAMLAASFCALLADLPLWLDKLLVTKKLVALRQALFEIDAIKKLERQQDVAEVSGVLLRGLSSLGAPGIGMVELVQQQTCTKCFNKKGSWEEDTMLHVALCQDGLLVGALIGRYLNPGGDHAMVESECVHCQLKHAPHQMTYAVAALPGIIPITLKRFEKHNTELVKNTNRVILPGSNCVEVDLLSLGGKSSKGHFEIVAMIAHHSTNGGNSIESGHYTALAKHGEGKWFHFNDQIASYVGDFRGMSEFFRQKNWQRDVYMIFLRKKQPELGLEESSNTPKLDAAPLLADSDADMEFMLPGDGVENDPMAELKKANPADTQLKKANPAETRDGLRVELLEKKLDTLICHDTGTGGTNSKWVPDTRVDKVLGVDGRKPMIAGFKYGDLSLDSEAFKDGKKTPDEPWAEDYKTALLLSAKEGASTGHKLLRRNQLVEFLLAMAVYCHNMDKKSNSNAYTSACIYFILDLVVRSITTKNHTPKKYQDLAKAFSLDVADPPVNTGYHKHARSKEFKQEEEAYRKAVAVKIIVHLLELPSDDLAWNVVKRLNQLESYFVEGGPLHGCCNATVKLFKDIYVVAGSATKEGKVLDPDGAFQVIMDADTHAAHNSNNYGSVDQGGLTLTVAGIEYCLLDAKWRNGRVLNLGKTKKDLKRANGRELLDVGGKWTTRKFRILKYIAGGKFCKQFLAHVKGKPHDVVTLRLAAFHPTDVNLISHELALGTAAKSGHVAKNFAFYAAPEVVLGNGKEFTIGMVMEACPSTLADLIKAKKAENANLTPDNFPVRVMEACSLVLQLFQGMEDLTTAGLPIGDRDLKPGNLLIGVDGKLKIADFGCPSSLKEEDLYAPFDVSKPHDTWINGIIFAECIMRELPFSNNNQRRDGMSQLRCYSFFTRAAIMKLGAVEKGLDKKFVNLMTALLNPHDENRLTADKAKKEFAELEAALKKNVGKGNEKDE